jgi:uncharacterized protein (DUF2336 family)
MTGQNKLAKTLGRGAMASLWRRLFRKEGLPEVISYEDARAVLETHETVLQEELAARSDAKPEMLYYLAEHGTPAARRQVAINPATPPAAHVILADDSDDDVRAELARKIGRLLPDLMESERTLICEQTIEALRRLARDQLPRVRAILANEIKHLDCVPADVIQMLAHDVEEAVSAPILEYSPLLADADLLEIVASARAQSALAAVARRRGLSEDVSEAIVASLDIPAVAALLANPDARIRESTFDHIVEHAHKILAWQGPLVLRSDLSVRTLRRVAGFVGSSLIGRIAERHDLDEETQMLLSRRLREKLDQAEEGVSSEERANNQAWEASKAGSLDDGFVEEAAEAGNRELLIASLGLLAVVPRGMIEKILASRNAKAATALVWRAGLSMRTAFKIQTLVLKLPADELLPARAGVAFPLTEEEMVWHLAYFGIVGETPARRAG